MVITTDLADWIGNFIEGIDSIYINSTPAIMLILGVITIISGLTIFFMWIKQQAQEGV